MQNKRTIFDTRIVRSERTLLSHQGVRKLCPDTTNTMESVAAAVAAVAAVASAASAAAAAVAMILTWW